MTEGYRIGWLANDLARRMRGVRGRIVNPRDAYAFKEFIALLRRIAGHRCEIGVFLAGFFGFRMGEVLACEVEDFDWEGKTVLVRGTKSEKHWVRLPLPDFALDFLQQRILGTGLLFMNRKRTKRMHASAMYHEVRSFMDGGKIAKTLAPERSQDMEWKQSVRRLSFHELRHTAGTVLARIGVPIQLASKILRHSSVAVTERYYIHIRTEDLRPGMTMPNEFVRGHAAI